MKKIFWMVALALTSSFVVTSAQACGCAPLGSDFFETVQRHNQEVASGRYPPQLALTVVTAEVKRYEQLRRGPYPTEMVLQVTDVLQGSLSSREILVEGDNGMQCRPYVTNFPIGQRFAFALEQVGGKFSIGICGRYSKPLN